MFREDQSLKGETVKNHFSRLATFLPGVESFLHRAPQLTIIYLYLDSRVPVAP